MKNHHKKDPRDTKKHTSYIYKPAIPFPSFFGSTDAYGNGTNSPESRVRVTIVTLEMKCHKG